MKVSLSETTGFCQGVHLAIAKAREARKANGSDIYVLGMLVHNEEVVGTLEKEGIHCLDEREGSLSSLMERLPKGSLFLFSAHGHPLILEEKAKQLGLRFVDATCPFVISNEKAIEEAAKENDCFYIGKPGHLECLSALSRSKRISLFNEKELPENIDSTSHPQVFVQTTMGLEEIQKAFRKIQSVAPMATLAGKRCPSAVKRQKAFSTLPSGVDLIIILGSQNSNNSKELLQKAKQDQPLIPSFLVLSKNELAKMDLLKYHHVYLASGASTPIESVEEAANYLKTI